MHILSSLTMLALTRLSIALPPLLLPLNTSSQFPLAINATALPREPWPKVPWAYSMSLSTTVAIDNYGRSVCSEDDLCQVRATVDIHRLLGIILQEYISGRGRQDTYTSGVAKFWIKQEIKVSEYLIDDLIKSMIVFAWAHGTTEVTFAAIIIHGELAATFALTYPGVED